MLGVGGKVDPLQPEGQVELSRNLQIATAAIDATGLCLFVAFAVLDNPAALEGICEMLSGLLRPAVHGRRLPGHRASGRWPPSGRFNAAAGFTAADDRLPDFFRTEKLPPHNITFARAGRGIGPSFRGNWVVIHDESSPSLRLCRFASVYRRRRRRWNWTWNRGKPIATVLDRLGIPPSGRRSLFVNHRAAEPDRALTGGERVDLFSAIGGG